MTLDRDCGEGQYLLRALTPGDYSVTGTILDASGNPLTNGMTKVDFAIPASAGTPTQVVIDFPFKDFVKDYTGNFYYLFRWGDDPGSNSSDPPPAATCAAALPPVVTRSVRLERGGHPLTDSTGLVIDGVTPGPCVDPSIPPQFPGLKWGPADLIIVGFDAASTPRFQETFHTFVGAGIATQVLTYDVDSLAPDAGPPPDAAPPDAGP
jgi:hypothetical protein